MSDGDKVVKRRAEEMSQAQFRGEAMVHFKYLRNSDEKQWTEIGTLKQKAEHAQTVEKCENHRRGLSRMNLLKTIAAIVAILGGAAGLILLLT